MNNFTSRKHLMLLSIICTIVVSPKLILAQNCECAQGLCCSQWGYCGTGNAYCGQGCQGGPCNTTTSTTNNSNTNVNTNTPTNNSNTNTSTSESDTNTAISSIVTESFFNGIAYQAASSCDGKGFYTRSAFLEAIKSYPRFGTVGSSNDTKREIAAFFAHVTHETGHMCYINEINGPSRSYCDEQNIEYPCVSGKKYYGRGPIQLSWNFNYGPAGKDIGFDGLNDPDIVARDNIISFKTALWYWMNNCHSLITSDLGFGATIRAIYGPFECDGGNPPAVARRIDYYTEYCLQLGVETGNNTSC